MIIFIDNIYDLHRKDECLIKVYSSENDQFIDQNAVQGIRTHCKRQLFFFAILETILTKSLYMHN